MHGSILTHSQCSISYWTDSALSRKIQMRLREAMYIGSSHVILTKLQLKISLVIFVIYIYHTCAAEFEDNELIVGHDYVQRMLYHDTFYLSHKIT